MAGHWAHCSMQIIHCLVRFAKRSSEGIPMSGTCYSPMGSGSLSSWRFERCVNNWPDWNVMAPWCFIWVCLKMVSTPKPNGFWSLSLFYGYFVGNIPYFQTNPYAGCDGSASDLCESSFWNPIGDISWVLISQDDIIPHRMTVATLHWKQKYHLPPVIFIEPR